MNDEKIIKYGISREYIDHWTIIDALREIYQNFQDYGDFEEQVRPSYDGKSILILSNHFRPTDLSYLKVGMSLKRDDKNTVGKYGEGLKMAALVLTREGHRFTISHDRLQLTGIFYQDEHLGECFGMKLTETTYAPVEGFTVEFDLPTEIINKYTKRKISPEQVMYTSATWGSLINKPAGEIYVGDLYVCNLPDMKYAYNFQPAQVQLDRDRKVPRAFDVEYAASMILSGAGKINMNNLDSRDASYIHNVPTEVVEQFEPQLIEDNIVFRAGKVQAPTRVKEILMNRSEMKQKLAELKQETTKTPRELMQEHYGQFKCTMTTLESKSFLRLLEASEEWIQA